MEKKSLINPEEEIVITGSDIQYLIEGVSKISSILDNVKIKDKKANHDLGVSMMALTVGILKLLPRDARRDSAKMFEKIFGFSIDKLLW